MRRIITAIAAGAVIFMSQPGAGRVARAGEGYNLTSIGPRETDVYRKYFRAGEVVIFKIHGAGRSGLDLRVRCPEHGQVVASHTAGSDSCVVRFRAPESGVYTFEIEERDGRGDAYEVGFLTAV
jgi:hypothetical protein